MPHRFLTNENLQNFAQAFDIMRCPKSKSYKLFLSASVFEVPLYVAVHEAPLRLLIRKTERRIPLT